MSWIEDLKELLFPRYCKVCGSRLMKSELHLCLECLLRLPRTHYEQKPENILMQHFMEWPEVVRATAYMYYHKESQYAPLIHHLKYYDHPETGTFLGRLAAKEIIASGFFDGIDLIVPVPLSPKKKRKRGYNQAELLAQELAAMLDVPCLPTLEKTRDTNPMHGLRPEERRANVLGAYRLCCSAETVAGKRVLVADDILTTGSTLSECARMLKTAGAVRVLCVCAAAARKS